MTIDVIQINDNWPFTLIWDSSRCVNNVTQDNMKLLALKGKTNIHVVHDFQILLEMLSQNTYKTVSIHINNIIGYKPDRVEMITSSIRTICSCINKPIPKICVYAFGFRDKPTIRQVIDSSVDVIDLNLDRRTNKDWETVSNSISQGLRYIDRYTLKYMEDLGTGSKRATKLTRRIDAGTVGYYLCPRVPVTDEIKDNVKRLKNDLNLDTYHLDKFIDLITVLSDPARPIDIIWVDAEEIADHGKVTPYDLVNTIVTLLHTTGRQYRTKLCITVDSSTPPTLMREVVKIKGVYSLFGRSPEFNYMQIKNQIKLILSNRNPTPDSIKALLAGKQPKTKTGIHLTNRERQIRDLVCTLGSSNKVIANTLGLTEATVKVHVGTIFKKYNVKSRAELVLKSKDL